MRKLPQIKLYIGKHEKPTDENIMRLLMPSVLGIIVCMICLLGSTWAWFTANIQIDGGQDASVQAANFSADVVIREMTGASDETLLAIQTGQSAKAVAASFAEEEGINGNNDDEASNALQSTEKDDLAETLAASLNEDSWKSVSPVEDDRTFSLKKDTAYMVEVTGKGSATIGGYVVISGGNRTYYTVDMQSSEARDGEGRPITIDGAEKRISFVIVPESDGEYKFTPVWGAYEGHCKEYDAANNGGASSGTSALTDAVENAGDLLAVNAYSGISWTDDDRRIGNGAVIGEGSLPVLFVPAAPDEEEAADGDSAGSTDADDGTASGNMENSGSDETSSSDSKIQDSKNQNTEKEETKSSEEKTGDVPSAQETSPDTGADTSGENSGENDTNLE